jgi:hypothetical protein
MPVDDKLITGCNDKSGDDVRWEGHDVNVGGRNDESAQWGDRNVVDIVTNKRTVPRPASACPEASNLFLFSWDAIYMCGLPKNCVSRVSKVALF